MSDTTAFDIAEKTDVLLKTAFGFPSTDESKAWYEETAIPFNNYVPGEDILIDEIPSIPDFDTNGIIQTATSIGLVNGDFANYSDDVGDKSICSIVDDSTGVVRRFQHIILDEVPQLSNVGLSWYKLNATGDNVIKDAFQFNYKQYTSNGNVINPYQYVLNTEATVSKTSKLPTGSAGGNWFIDIKSGVLFFPDFGNLASSSNDDYKITSSNKPVLTIYVYVGNKGIANFTAESSSFDNNADLSLNSNLDVGGKLEVANTITTYTNLNAPVINTDSIYQF